MYSVDKHDLIFDNHDYLFHDSFQQLNAGGAITGVPKHLREQQLRERQRQAAVNAPSPTVIERC